MAKATAGNANATIDTNEVLPEEIPAELLERMSENHPNLVRMELQVRRGGHWKLARNGTRSFAESPPQVSVYDLCALLLKVAKQDAETTAAEMTRYRVRMRCRLADHEYSRFANVRGCLDEYGEVQIQDDESADGDATIKALQLSAQQNAAITFQCLNAVMQCTQGFAQIAKTFQDVLGAAGAVWKDQVSGQVDLLRVKLEMEQAGYQHAEKPRDGGPWTSEQIFQIAEHNNANYIVPPITHAGAGPSGLAYYSGVGLPEKYNDTFFMCDYRGQAVTSGIWAFKNKPKGASFELTSVDGKPITRDTKIQDASIFYGTGVVDAEQGPDGSLYVADWTQGWDRPFRGRIYRVVDEQIADSAIVAETKKLIGEGMEKRSAEELIKLLSHADMRVRQEAQFALAKKADTAFEGGKSVARSPDGVKALLELHETVKPARFGEEARPTLVRLHAIWALGQLARARHNDDGLSELAAAVVDNDLEVRCQAARVLGDIGDDRIAVVNDALLKLASDPEPRARYFAAMALGKLGKKDAVPTLLNVLKDNADKDAVLRFGVVWALSKLADENALAALSSHDNVSVGWRVHRSRSSSAIPTASSSSKPPARSTICRLSMRCRRWRRWPTSRSTARRASTRKPRAPAPGRKAMSPIGFSGVSPTPRSALARRSRRSSWQRSHRGRT